MIEKIVDIETRAGAMETFTCRPERGGPFPPVLFLMDAPGIREELYQMARRLASVGYFVLLPNLYYRAGRETKYGPDVLEKGSAEQAAMRAVRTRMTIPPVMEDVGDMLAWLDGQADAAPGPVGTHGYCMSGPYSLAAAARYPDRVAAAASWYRSAAATGCAASSRRCGVKACSRRSDSGSATSSSRRSSPVTRSTSWACGAATRRPPSSRRPR